MFYDGRALTVIAEGVALIAQAQSKLWHEKTFANPNRIAPDHLAKSGRKVNVVSVNAKLVLENGAREVGIVPNAELYRAARR